MRSRVAVAALFAAAVFVPQPLLAQSAGAPTPERRLVYSFGFDVKQNGEVTNDPGSTGAQNFSGATNDMGTISVDIMSQQPDGGLFVMVSEAAQGSRKAGPAACIVYPNTDVHCDPGKTVNNEEYAAVRYLSQKFVDPNQFDAKQHWQVKESSGPSTMSADFAVMSNNNGMMQIQENQDTKMTGAGAYESTVQSKIGYDFNRAVPDSIDEYVIQRQYGGIQATSEATFQTTLKLQSDSMAKQ